MTLLAHQPLRGTWPGQLENIRAARHWLRDQMTALGFPPSVVYTAETVACELVTNAVRHTCSGHEGGRFRLEIDAADPWIYIGVTDEGSSNVPAAEEIDDLPDIPVELLPEGGLGLAMVEQLAVDWGFRPFGEGRTTWATIART